MSHAQPLLDWPAQVVACADSLTAASQDTNASPAIRDMVIELNGAGPRQISHLLRFLATRLSLPDLSTADLETMQLSIERRLNVLAKAQRRVTLALSEPEALPAELLNSLLLLTNNTDLRLLLIGQPIQTEHCKTLTEAAGLGWQQLGEAFIPTVASVVTPPVPTTPFTPRTPPVAGNRRSLIVAGIAAVVIIGCGLWFGTQQNRAVSLAVPTSSLIEPTSAPTISKIVAPQTTELATPTLPDRIEVPTPAPSQSAIEEQVATASTALPSVNSALFPAGTRYTIQIASYRRADFREEFMKLTANNLSELRSVDITIKDGDRKMLVVYGAFTGYTAAMAAASNLPQGVNLGRPYVIPVSAEMVRPSQEHND